MTAIATPDELRGRLRERRETLRGVIAAVGPADDLERLLRQVDAALERVGTPRFGRCAVCDEPFERDELLENPLRQYCLCALSDRQRAALEHDLDLAWRIQASLLPRETLSWAGWSAHFRFLPAGPLSGDCCDIVEREPWVYFLVGDVSGKGVAAAYLSAHLSATVRASLERATPVSELVEKLNRYLAANTPASHFVTLVCGRAAADGRIELCNAGHCPPLVVRRGGVRPVDSSGLPLGITAEGEHATQALSLEPGESLVLYTDGVTEAADSAGQMYGVDAFAALLRASNDSSPIEIADACLRDLRRFQDGAQRTDDVTLLVLKRDG
jgi:sigma-B regulation protein RsbU (phosphoserine phosphatase)